MAGGFLGGLAQLGTDLGTGLTKLGTGLGDFIGLDGSFGLGGADKAFSLGNLGNAASDVFSTNANGSDGLAGMLSSSLEGATLPDYLSAGGGVYGAIKQADAAEANIANQRRVADASLNEQARQRSRQEEMDKVMADAYASSTGRVT